MKALVTGAGGFLGTHLLTELARRGDEVCALVRPSSSAREGLESDGVEVIAADLRRPPADLESALGGFDVVYHLAAGVGAGWRATFETNVTATENLVGAVQGSGFAGRFVHVSSFSVYGFNQARAGSVVDESTPLEPHPGRRDDYAWSKLLQERVVGRLAEAGQVELVVVRPGAIYGRERPFQYRLGRPLGKNAVLMLGGRNPMPLSYVENTASLIAECGHNPAAAGGVFNAVDPQPVRQRDYMRAWRRSAPDMKVIPFPLTVYRAIGRALQVAERRTGGSMAPPPFLDPYVVEPSMRRFRYDGTRAGSVLGWSPPVSTEEGLERTFPPTSRS